MGMMGLLFFYGLRHGFDWDHIAAITSISGSQDSKKTSFVSSFFYILGHASIILLLGGLAILFGLLLPHWVDNVMEPVVGVTLISLGIYMIISFFRHGHHVQLISRAQMMLSLFRKVKRSFSKKAMAQEEEVLTYSSPFVIGCIHGIGAETPTQMLLFMTLGGVSGKGIGLLLLLIFVIGLVLSNSVISSLSVLGYAKLKSHSILSIAVIIISAILSISIGISMLLGHGLLLPALISG